MKRKIYSASLLAVYRQNFLNSHSGICVHPTKTGDLDKEATVAGKHLKLIGMNDENSGVFIEESTGHLYTGELGHFKFALTLENKSRELECYDNF